MTRIGFSVLGAAGIAAILAMGMLTTAAEAATRKLCNSGAKTKRSREPQWLPFSCQPL